MSNSLNLRKAGKRMLYQIVIIGAGANGSHFFRGLCQDLSTYDKQKKWPYDVHFSYDLLIADGDRVEKKNLNNQLFDESDLDEHKVISLAERYGDHYDLEVKRVPSYIKSLADLERLFPDLERSPSVQKVPVLIGMVDNNKTRQLMDDFFYSSYLESLVYIDAGVEGVLYTNQKRLSSEEKRSQDHSGFGGQVVCGLKFEGEVILEPVAQVFSNIWEDELSHFPGEGCGTLIHEAPQRCATNKMAGQLVNGVMNNLFHTNAIYTHIINFNAQTGCSGGRNTFITDEAVRILNHLKGDVILT